MEHNELFVPFFRQNLIYQRQQVAIVKLLGLRCSLPATPVWRLFNELPFVCFLTKKVDKRMVRQLIREENGVETGLFKGRNESFLVI